MNWQRIKKLILFFVAAFLVIAIAGVAVAGNDSESQIFKMDTDVIVREKQIMTDVVAVGGDVTVLNEGRITQDAVAIGGDVILKQGAIVGGNAVAIGGQIVKDASAVVSGDEVVMFSNAGALFNRFGLLGTLYITNALIYLAASIFIFVFGLFLLLLIPDRLQSITATMQQEPFKSGLWGLGSIVAIMLFAALFGGSILGFLLIPIVNLTFAVVGLLGAIAIALWIGKITLARRERPFIPFLVGMFILAIVSLIPIVGGLIVLMLNLFGIGAVLLSRVGTVRPETMNKNLDRLKGSTQPSGG